VHVLLHVYARSVCSCMFMYVTFAVNAMRIFGNNRKIIVNNWTVSQELWNRIIGKILSIIASGLVVPVLKIPSEVREGEVRLSTGHPPSGEAYSPLLLVQLSISQHLN